MPTILAPLQNSFLAEFFHLTQDFYLTGGTALSAFFLPKFAPSWAAPKSKIWLTSTFSTEPVIQFQAISTWLNKKTEAWLMKHWRTH